MIVNANSNEFSVIEAEARRGCAIHGRKPVAVSHKCMDQYCIRAQYLFACKE